MSNKQEEKKILKYLEENPVRRKWTKQDEKTLADIEEKLFPKTYDDSKRVQLSGVHVLAFVYLAFTSIAFPYADSGWSGATWWDHCRLMISLFCILKMSVVFDNFKVG